MNIILVAFHAICARFVCIYLLPLCSYESPMKGFPLMGLSNSIFVFDALCSVDGTESRLPQHIMARQEPASMAKKLAVRAFTEPSARDPK